MLASIQKILQLEEIPGADAIEKATVLGWQVVVKKGQFKVGELCVYIQIDTIAPEIPFFEFLRERSFRIRSIKLRKCLSQGLIVSKDDCLIINSQLPNNSIFLNWKEGEDASEFLNIKKYSKEVNIPEEKISVPKTFWKRMKYYWHRYILHKGKFLPTKAPFPTDLVHKTDEERIQNIPWVLEKYAGKEFSVTEKLDGSSITIIRDKKRSWLGKTIYYDRICSRNYELLNKTNEWYKVYESNRFEIVMNKLQDYFQTYNIIVQGEYIGKPQGNPYKVDNQIRVFNIFVEKHQLQPEDFDRTCNHLQIPRCPRLANFVLYNTMSIQNLLNIAENKSQLNVVVEREGIVMRSLDGTLSFKVISNKFLLKNNE